jgi:tRNA uridine 5-carboxymethylaminomethyl modification enzyme
MQGVKLSDLIDVKKNKLSDENVKKIEIYVKFEGYINKQEKYIQKLSKFENFNISNISDYRDVKNLSLEAIEKLNKIRPFTLGQALRIPGINLSDIFMIKFHLESRQSYKIK